MERKKTTTDADIRAWFAATLAAAQPGDRLPTVRAIMTRFAVGQRRVEAILAPLIAEGRIVARRGAGLCVAGPEAAAASPYEADVLILYRLSDSRLARTLLQEIEVRLRARGITMLHIGYANEERAISLLERTQRFRVCLLQLHFETLSLAFLATLNAHADHLVIDGVSVTGIGADGLGTNWTEALTTAFFRLLHSGHRRIAFLTSSHSARQIATARQEYHVLCRNLTPATVPLLLEMDRLPGEYRREEIAAALRQGAAPAADALIAWGVVEGYLLERALLDLGLRPGVDLSVILLGSTDFPSEHLDVFDVVGNRNVDKLDLFERVIVARLGNAALPVRTHYLPIHVVDHGSVRDRSDEV